MGLKIMVNGGTESDRDAHRAALAALGRGSDAWGGRRKAHKTRRNRR